MDPPTSPQSHVVMSDVSMSSQFRLNSSASHTMLRGTPVRNPRFTPRRTYDETASDTNATSHPTTNRTPRRANQSIQRTPSRSALRPPRRAGEPRTPGSTLRFRLPESDVQSEMQPPRELDTVFRTPERPRTEQRSESAYYGSQPRCGLLPINSETVARTPKKEDNDEWLANFGIDIELLKIVDAEHRHKLDKPGGPSTIELTGVDSSQHTPGLARSSRRHQQEEEIQQRSQPVSDIIASMHRSELFTNSPSESMKGPSPSKLPQPVSRALLFANQENPESVPNRSAQEYAMQGSSDRGDSGPLTASSSRNGYSDGPNTNHAENRNWDSFSTSTAPDVLPSSILPKTGLIPPPAAQRNNEARNEYARMMTSSGISLSVSGSESTLPSDSRMTSSRPLGDDYRVASSPAVGPSDIPIESLSSSHLIQRPMLAPNPKIPSSRSLEATRKSPLSPIPGPSDTVIESLSPSYLAQQRRVMIPSPMAQGSSIRTVPVTGIPPSNTDSSPPAATPTSLPAPPRCIRFEEPTQEENQQRTERNVPRTPEPQQQQATENRQLASRESSVVSEQQSRPVVNEIASKASRRNRRASVRVSTRELKTLDTRSATENTGSSVVLTPVKTPGKQKDKGGPKSTMMTPVRRSMRLSARHGNLNEKEGIEDRSKKGRNSPIGEDDEENCAPAN